MVKTTKSGRFAKVDDPKQAHGPNGKYWTVLMKKACKSLIAEYAKMKCDVRIVQQWYCKIKYHGGTAITAVITVWV